MPTNDPNALIEMILGMLADALADRLAARSTPPRPTHYGLATELPKGCKSPRAMRDQARRLGVPLIRVGRCVVVDAAEWHAAIERQTTTTTTSSATSTTTMLVSDSDAATLRALGVLQ